MQSRLESRRHGRGSSALGAVLLGGTSLLLLAACVALPPSSPNDPLIPGTATPVFTDLAPAPTTNGPTEPPVPTTAPGNFSLGQSATIHTDRGSTWEITVTESIDPANSMATLGCSGSGGAAVPRSGERFVVAEIEIENVGVIETHPVHDLTFGYQPDGGPITDQNSAANAAAPLDLGCIATFLPGDRETVQVIVAVRDDASTSGTWIISPTDGQIDPTRTYNWR